LIRKYLASSAFLREIKMVLQANMLLHLQMVLLIRQLTKAIIDKININLINITLRKRARVSQYAHQIINVVWLRLMVDKEGMLVLQG